MNTNKQQVPARVVVIGGGYAGIMAATRLTRQTSRQQVEVILVNPSDTFVERIRLHQQSVGNYGRHIPLRTLLHHRVKHLAGKVAAIQPTANQVIVDTAGGAVTVAYDYLIYAVGSRIDRDALPGVRDFAHTLEADSVTRLRDRLQALETGGSLVIVGGGLTGIEAATEFAEAYPGIQITLLTRGRLAEGISRKGYEILKRAFDRLHIRLVEHTPVSHLEAGQVVTQSGQVFPADAILWTGAFAVPTLARDSGIQTNAAGQVLVDAYLRSLSHPNILVAGDSTGLTHLPPLRMACATALPTGAQVADNVAALVKGQPLREFHFGYVLQCISLGRHGGLVQMVNPNDSPREQVISGRAGALIKEVICRSTVLFMKLERFGRFYAYPRPQRSAAAVEAAGSLRQERVEVR